jgi:energy-converting hydrogenase Eha subunit C
MTNEQVGGLIRTAAAYGFGLLSAKGYIDAATSTALVGAVGTIGVAAWSWWSKKRPA